jgi:formylmethanofuran dehydrogenase subunit D
MRIVPFVEFAAYSGTQGFSVVVDMVKKKKIKNLINFGELFPFYYPQLSTDLKAANIYATSPIKYSDHNVLPVPLTLEKEGSVITTFGKRKLSANIEPPSGAMSINSILEMLSDEKGVAKPIAAPETKVNVLKRAQGLAERVLSRKKGMRLIGEKISYNFLGFYEPEALKINPGDAAEFGIRANDTATVTTKHGSVDLMVKLTDDVGKGIVAVAAETPAVKGLFAYEVDPDTKSFNFIPTEVKICRKE